MMRVIDSVQGYRHLVACIAGALLLSGCATPYVRPAAPEIVTPALHADHAVMADGYVLPLSVWRPPSSEPVRAVVLALHGLNDYRQAYAGVGPYLAARGIVTYAYDQRGFGETVAPGVWHGGERVKQDLRVMAGLLRTAYKDIPLYAMGESLGGAVILSTARDSPPDVDGVILIAPAVWARSTMPLLQRATLWLATRLIPGKTFTGESLPVKITPSDNKAMLAALFKDPRVIKKTRVDVLYGTTQLMDLAYVAGPALSVPTLILYGQRDQIIPKRPICDFLNKLPRDVTRKWRAVIYPSGYHMLTRDLQRETVLEDIFAWISDKRAALPSGEEALTEASPFLFCKKKH